METNRNMVDDLVKLAEEYLILSEEHLELYKKQVEVFLEIDSPVNNEEVDNLTALTRCFKVVNTGLCFPVFNENAELKERILEKISYVGMKECFNNIKVGYYDPNDYRGFHIDFDAEILAAKTDEYIRQLLGQNS